MFRTFSVLPKQYLPTSKLQRFSPLLSFGSCRLLVFMIKSTICHKLIQDHLWMIKAESHFFHIFKQQNRYFAYSNRRDFLFPHWIALTPLSKMKKIKNRTYNPATPLLGRYPKEVKAPCPRNTCTHTLTAAYAQQQRHGNKLSVHPQMNG